MARIACVMVADFSVAAIVRSNPALADKVLAIGISLAAHAEIEAASLRARELGIRLGMTIAQARAISSDLVMVHRSPAAESSAQSALLDAVESVSPMAEPGAPGCAWLDLAGLQRIYNGEEEIIAELVQGVRRAGIEPTVGIAANKELAQLAARCGGVRVIEAGREREFLNWLPLDMLNLGKSDHGDDLETTLARWGVRRLGELARLNPNAVGTRLGRHGVELVHLARGGSHAPLVPCRRAEFFVETIELEYGIELLEPLGFVMRAMLERLTERLSMRGLVAGDITLALGMSGHRSFSRRVEVAAPSNDVRAILTLISLSLEGEPPKAAVESIRIEIAPRVPRPAQTDMFLPSSPAPDKLQTTIARLAALCGPGNVGMLAAENSHRPEAMRLDPFAPPAAPPIRENAPTKNVTQLVIRAIRPAREIEMMCSQELPEFVRGENLGARVISIAGPWRRDGEWWLGCTGVTDMHADLSDKKNSVPQQGLELHDGRGFGAHPRQVSAENLKTLSSLTPAPSLNSHRHGDPALRMNGAGKSGFIRDYYELALADGGVYRVFRDVNSQKWFLDGVYD